MIYFETFSAPTADTLFLFILSILALESAHSIRFLYQHFLSGITEKSLNVFYYAQKVKLSNLKQMAQTVAYIQEHGYDSLDDFHAALDQASD